MKFISLKTTFTSIQTNDIFRYKLLNSMANSKLRLNCKASYMRNVTLPCHKY